MPPGGRGNSDFYLSFGSNASPWAKGLAAELAPARRELAAIGNLLSVIDKGTSSEKMKALGAVLGRAGAPATSGHAAAAEIDTSKIMGQIDGIVSELKTASEQIARTMGHLGKLPDAAREQVEFYNRSTAQKKRIAEGRGSLPNQQPGVLASGPVEQLLQRMARGGVVPGHLAQPSSVRVASVTQAQMDRGQIDRLVRAVHEVRDAVKAQGIRPGQKAGGGTTTTTTTPAPAAKQTETAVQTLRRRVAEAETAHQQLKALSEAAGDAISDAQKAQLQTLQEVLSTGKAALAKAEREEQGITRGQQKTARREASAFQRGPDLDEAEYDRRQRIMRGINVAAAGGLSAGRGKGQYSKTQMQEIARELSKLGFAVDFNAKTKAQDLARGIASASTALKSQYGAETPDDLKTGRRLVADKVHDSVREIIEAANIGAVEAAEEAQARDVVRMAHLVGDLPKDATQRLTGVTGRGATSLAGQRLSGPIGVPPGMVKGGQYGDQFGYMNAINMLRGRSLGRAANLAMSRPDFDPYKVNLRESVTGQGEEAKAARTAFRELRNAYRELDDLGEQFQIFTQALNENESFIKRASDRLGTAGEKPEDQAKIAAAQERTALLRTALDGQQFKGLQDVFEDPTFQAGLAQRSVSRREQDAWIASMDEQKRNRVDVRDAMGGAIADSRLVPGTKDTYVRGVPGMRFDRQNMRYAFTDAQRNPAELDKLNRAASFFSLQQRSHAIGEEVAAGERPQGDLDDILRRTENQAVRFSNELERIFKTVIPVSRLLQGQGGEAYQFVDPRNEAAEQRRMDRYRQQQELTNKKPPKKSELTDEQKAHEADQQLRVAKLRLKKATDRQAEAAEKVTQAEKELERGFNALPKGEQAQFAQARGQLDDLVRQRNSLENIFLREDPAAREERAAPTGDPGEVQRIEARVAKAREEEARLRKQEAAQRAAVTKARKALAEEEGSRDLRAPMAPGARALLQPEGRMDYVPKPVLERKSGAWLGDLQKMEARKVDSLLKDIGSPMRHGTHTIQEIAKEFENWQKGARRIGEVSPDAQGQFKGSGATMYDVADPRYGRGSTRAGASPLAGHLNRISNWEMGFQQGDKRIHAPEGLKGVFQMGADPAAQKRLVDFFTKHLGKGMPQELMGELRKFVHAAGTFVAGEGSVHGLEGPNSPKFDILRDLASKSPAVDQGLYRGMKRAPRFDEHGNILGSTRDLASWTSSQETADLFGANHQLKMVGGRALSLGSMGGMDEYLAHGEYKLKRQYEDPSGRMIYEVEQVAKAEAKATTASERFAKATQKLTDVENKLAAARAKVADLERSSFPFVSGKGAHEAAVEGQASATALAQKYPDRGHSPGEKLDTLGYPSALGYAPDLGDTKARLDKELARVRDILRKALPKETSDRIARQIAELDRLKAGRAGLTSTIAAAREEGDLKENAGYHAAKEEQGRAEARITELEREISEAFGVEALEKFVRESQLADKEVADLTSTIKELGGAVSGTKKGAPTKASDRVVSETEEAKRLRQQVNAGGTTRADYSKLRQARDKVEKGGAEWQRLTDEMAAMRKQGIPTRAEMKKLRQRLAVLDKEAAAAAGAGAGAGGTGGGKPTARGAAGGGGPGDNSTNKILRDILTAVNGIHRTIQTRGGTKTVRVDEAGNPVARKPRTSQSASIAELKQAQSGDPRQVALAAAAQQQRLERLRPANISSAQTQAINENNRLNNLTQAQAHQKLQLARATKQLDVAAKQELATLRQLVKSGADNERIAEQQARAVGAMNRAFSQSGVTHAADRKTMGRALLSDASGSKIGGDLYEQVSRSSRSIDGFKAVDQSMAQGVPQGGMFGEHSQFTQAMFGNSGFWSRVMSSTGTFVVRNFAAGFVFGMTNALQEVIKQAILTESTFIRVSDALEQTGRETGDLRTQLQGISTQYGTALNDVYETAAGLTGMFDSVDEIAGATKVVAQLQMISMGALNASETMGVLASITGAYGSELEGGVSGLEHVADVLTVVQNTLGTNVEVTSEGVGRLSGLSKQLKIDFEDTAVYVAQIAKLTNQTGAAAGEQFSRILGAMQTGRGRAALQQELPGSGIAEMVAGGDYGTAIQALMKQWDGLSDTQKRNLTVSLAGQRQAAAFAALMNNSTKVLNASARAHDANGEAAQRSEKIANTLNNMIAKLMANFQNLAHELVRSGILTSFGILLKATNATLGVINHLLSSLNDMADNNPFLNFLKMTTMGILGLVLTLKLAGAAFAGFRASMAAVGAGPGAMGAFARGAQGATRPTLAGGLTGASGGLSAFAQSRKDAADRAARQGLGVRAVPGQAGVPLTERKLEQAPRTFAVSSAGVAQQQDLTRRQQMQIKANQALARSAEGAAKGAGASARGMQALAGSGLALTGVMIAATVAVAVITKEFHRVGEMADKLKGISDTYDAAGKPKSEAEKQEEYIGPATELAKQNRKDTGGWFSAAVWDVTHIDAPHWGTENDADVQRWRGQLEDGMQARLDNLDKTMEDTLGKLDYGDSKIDDSSLASGTATRIEAGLAGATQAIRPTASVEQATAAGAKIGDAIAAERKDIFAQFDAGEITEAQAAEMLAGVEKVADETNDRVAAIILRARGVAEADQLSLEQMKQIDTLRGAFSALQGSEALGSMTSGHANVPLTGLSGTTVGVDYNKNAAFLDRVIEETGAKEGGVVEKQLRKLQTGGLNRVQSLRAERKIIDVESDNAQAAWLAAIDEGTKEPEEMDELKDMALSKLQELNAKTEEILQAAADAGTQIADAATRGGHYERGVAAIERAMRQMSRERDRVREYETPEQAAQRDVRESTLAEQGARTRAEGLNKRLELAKGRNQGSQREAQLEQQIAQNEFFALKQMEAAAKIAGTEGPPVAALRAAKIRWIESQISVAQQAQQANIAAMAAIAAGLWNGTAIAGAQEEIALQQYKDAVKNTGSKNSTEALNAWAAYKSAQHNTITTMDSVAQAQRDATQAAIPQGNQVAVAQQAVANAHAALAAAEKYSHNSVEYQGALSQLYSAQQQAMAAQAAVAAAQAQLAVAYADARGDAVASARANVHVAQVTLANARAASGGALSADVLAAQAQLIAANAAVSQAQTDLVTSRVQVSIALADAAGHTVRSAQLALKMARIRLHAALRKSGGEATAEVNQARAEAVSAEAAARDAVLQDQLDTIDFNVQMGRMTQSAAIAALQQILRTHDLTKQQRRDLMLQIKNMKDEISGDGMWNFGDIKLPRPYQMRRYIEAHRKYMDRKIDDALGDSRVAAGVGGGGSTYNDNRNVQIDIHGGNLDEVRKVIKEVVGRPTKTRTTQPRRGRR